MSRTEERFRKRASEAHRIQCIIRSLRYPVSLDPQTHFRSPKFFLSTRQSRIIPVVKSHPLALRCTCKEHASLAETDWFPHSLHSPCTCRYASEPHSVDDSSELKALSLKRESLRESRRCQSVPMPDCIRCLFEVVDWKLLHSSSESMAGFTT